MKTYDWNAFASADPAVTATLLVKIKTEVASTIDPLKKALLLLGAETCYSTLGQFAEAHATLADARQIAPPNERFFQMHADFHEARLCSAENRLRESLDRFDEMLTKYRQDLKHPDSRYLYEEIQRRRGMALALLERCSEALPLLRESEPSDLSDEDRSSLYCYIGHCHHRLSEDDLALPYFLKARSLGLSKYWRPHFHYDLGYVYYRLGNYQDARREFLSCEDQIKSGLPAPPAGQVYRMLSNTAKALGHRAEADLYSAMANPS